MLEDRTYMRRSPLETRRSAVVWLLIANLVAFGLQCLFYGYPLRIGPGDYFALSIDGLRHWFVWQLVTFQFMHAGLLHLALNCLAIFMFGRSVEEALGRTSFLALYFAGGIIGGLFQALAGALFGGVFASPVVGASAGVFAIIAAFAVLYPSRPVTLFLVVFPVTLQARTFLFGSAGVALLLLFFPVTHVANAAHLGGLLTGVFFVRSAAQCRWQWPRLRRPISQPQLVKVRSQKSVPWGQTTPVPDEELSPDEFLSKEVDPILEKISAQGIQSLSDRERKILEQAQKQMARKR